MIDRATGFAGFAKRRFAFVGEYRLPLLLLVVKGWRIDSLHFLQNFAYSFVLTF